MTKPEFVYTSYINTTPERLWQALTDPAFTTRYWSGVSFDTDWQKGSRMTWHVGDRVIEDAEQVVLEADPYRRLSYTWHTYTADWAEVNDIPADVRAALLAEPRSTITFELEPQGDAVKLTVVHEGGPAVLSGVSEGWPAIVSSLKSLLETGNVVAT